MTVEILRVHEDYVTKTMFTLTLTEWLASPGGTKFSKPIEVFLHVCEEERWHVL